jgi:hypothetical protein
MRRVGSKAFAVAAVVALTGCGGAPGAPASPSFGGSSVDWLGGRGAITTEALGRAMQLGAADPVARALFDEAIQRIGGGRLEGLAAQVTPCGPDVVGESGLTKVDTADVYVPRSLEELAFGTRAPETDQVLAAAGAVSSREIRVRTEPDFLVVERTSLPRICILPRLSLAEAYETLVHELVHALRMDPRRSRALALQPIDEAAFRVAVALEPGGEVEAYSTSLGARIRLREPARLTSPLLPFFDPHTGAPLANGDTLAALVLAPRPQGLGYATGTLEGALGRAREALAKSVGAERTMLEAMLAERRTNIPLFEQNVAVHTHNLGVFQHNLDLATARGSSDLAAKSRAGLDDTARKLARTKALLEAARASEARITALLATLDVEEK